IEYTVCVEVNTTSGVVKGLTIDVLNTSVDQFLAIPYAEPPVGVLRFAKPVPLKHAIKPHIDGRAPGNSCVQKFIKELEFDRMGNITKSEDCLVLNVWTPTVRTGDRQKAHLKPVMFWIYGGAFLIGSIFQQQYNASLLAAHNVVVVSVNYRLGPFGFLYGDREDAPGNVGLYDQLLALKWVRENIYSFGGDRDQITIFGESAGSQSVSAHILSPLSKGLFKRAIIQSGALLFNKARDPMVKSEALLLSKGLAENMNCSLDENKWLDCLRGSAAQELIEASDGRPQVVTLFDTEFLPMNAQHMFKQRLSDNYIILDLDIMAGVMRNEGSILGQGVVKPNLTVNDFKEFVSLMNTIHHNIDEKRVIDFYLQSIDKNSSDALKWTEYDIFGDLLMTCPTYRFAKAYAQLGGAGGVYFYEQTYQRKSFLDEKLYGVTHQADVDYPTEP
ncbi:unnamed protein product, partial [Medioppia subpectinata]